MNLEEKTISSDEIYNGVLLQVVKDKVLLPNGHTSVREIVRHPGGVCVLAVDEYDRVYFVRQFRYPYKKELLELPAGKLDKGGGESSYIAAVRELREETGIEAESLVSLGEIYPSVGFTDEIIHLYFTDQIKQYKQDLDDDEFINVEKIPYAKAVTMALNGELKDAKTVAAILKVYAMRVRGEFNSEEDREVR